MKIFGSITELVTAVFRKNSQEITLRPNQAVTYTGATDVQLAPSTAASQELVEKAASQTLTNKIVDGDNNSLSNIAITSLKTVLADANKVILRNASGAVVSSTVSNANIDAAANIALTKLATVTASRALTSDGAGNITASSITTTELGHLSGVTSNIQTQLNSKEPTITILPVSKGGTNSSTSLNNNRLMISSGSAIVEASALTASRALASDASGLPVASATTSTELGYLSGVTSAVQTQINAKADTSALTAHTGASSGVHGVTGSVVGTTDTQVLTNKDHDGGTASNASRFTLPKANKSVLDGLTRKQATLVYGSDTNKVYADDGSTLKEIGSGSSGINYLSGQYGADSLGTVQTSVGDVLASSTRSNPTQWGNSAASALITQSTDSTLRGTTNYLVAYTANAQFVESPLFSIDGEDLGKPLLVQFDVSGVGTADDVQVYIARYNSSNVLQERILVAGTASATTPNSAQVPTGVTTFKGFFIPSATSTDKYAIRWLRNANNTSMRLDTFFVGPQSLAQGAVVTEWQSYTPTLTNFTSAGTNASNTGKWRRVGDSVEIFITTRMGSTGTASGIFYWSLPTGLTVDSNKLPTGGSGIRIAPGSLVWFDRSANQFANATPSIDTGVNAIWAIATGTGGASNIDNTLVPTNADDSFSISIRVPISQWSSGTTTLADRAVEEYAWNNNLSNADSITKATDEGYGPTGARFPNVSTSNKIKRVWFQSPILETDSLHLEIKWGGQWLPISATGLGPVNSATLGMAIDDSNITSTSCDVVFGSAGYGASTGVSSGGWPSLAGSDNYKWRVRKVSGGAAVGFPVSARNIVGDTSGTAVPDGYVGQRLISSGTQTGSASGTVTVNLGTGVTLTPGVWIAQAQTEASAVAPRRVSIAITNSSNTVISDSDGFTYSASLSDTSNAANANSTNTGLYYFRVPAGSTQIIKAQAIVNFPSAGGTVSILLQAIRIA